MSSFYFGYNKYLGAFVRILVNYFDAREGLQTGLVFVMCIYLFVCLLLVPTLNWEPHTGRVHTPSQAMTVGLGWLSGGTRSKASCKVGRLTSLSAASSLNVSEGDKEIMGPPHPASRNPHGVGRILSLHFAFNRKQKVTSQTGVFLWKLHPSPIYPKSLECSGGSSTGTSPT